MCSTPGQQVPHPPLAYAPHVSRRRRRTVRRLLFGATLTVILAVVVREPLLPPSLINPIVNARLVHGLGLSPVLTDVQGPCPSTKPPNMIWAATYDTCLTLAKDGLHVTTIKAVQIVDDGPFWTVHLELDDQDAAALARVTRTLASNTGPQRARHNPAWTAGRARPQRTSRHSVDQRCRPRCWT